MEEPQLEPDQEGQPQEYATRGEAERAIAALTSADKKKLMLAARFWWKECKLQGTDVEPEDLFQEAILRTLKREDPRRWRKARVSMLKHLDRGMESVATHHRDRLAAERRRARTSRSMDPPPRSPTASAPSPPTSSNPESQVAARQEIEQVRILFVRDTLGFEAVCCRAHGMSASEIQRELGMDARQWEAVRKRVQRTLARYLNRDREET